MFEDRSRSTLANGARVGDAAQVDRAQAAFQKEAWLLSGAAAAVVIAAGTWYWRNANAPSITSIAVLPFTNTTPQAETEYLTDGITEGIINSLSSAPRLKVIARTTAFTFKGKEIDPQAIGRQLGVEVVLTGKISQRGDSIDIQTDLVKVADRSQLWGENFRRRIADVQRLQADIAGEIADKLRLRLSGEARQRVTRRYTESSEAFQLVPQSHAEPRSRTTGRRNASSSWNRRSRRILVSQGHTFN